MACGMSASRAVLVLECCICAKMAQHYLVPFFPADAEFWAGVARIGDWMVLVLISTV